MLLLTAKDETKGVLRSDFKYSRNQTVLWIEGIQGKSMKCKSVCKHLPNSNFYLGLSKGGER